MNIDSDWAQEDTKHASLYYLVRYHVLYCADVVFLGSGVSVEPDNHWGSQINQLEQLIDKLECEVCMKSGFVSFSSNSHGTVIIVL